jgi:hypothetical protein
VDPRNSNPYAPSKASLQKSAPNPNAARPADITAWRDDRIMVMLPDAPIPHRCVKCNDPVEEPTKTRKVFWHSPWLYLLLLFNVLIFAIVAAVVRKKATVAAGLCSIHKKRRRAVLTIAWIGALLGIVLIFIGADSAAGIGAVLFGILVVLGSIIFGMLTGRIVVPTRIDDRYVRLKGCGEAYLDTLPPFPG